MIPYEDLVYALDKSNGKAVPERNAPEPENNDDLFSEVVEESTVAAGALEDNFEDTSGSLEDDFGIEDNFGEEGDAQVSLEDDFGSEENAFDGDSLDILGESSIEEGSLDVIGSEDIGAEDDRIDILGDLSEEEPSAVSSGELSSNNEDDFDMDLGLDDPPPPPADIPKGTVMGMPAPEVDSASGPINDDTPLPPPPEN